MDDSLPSAAMMPMLGNAARFALHRLWTGLAAVLLIVGMIELVGPYVLDPSVVLMGDAAGGNDLHQIRAALGLDRLWSERLLKGLAALVGAEEAKSYRLGLPVSSLIHERWETTLVLMAWAIATALSLGSLVGLLASKWKWARVVLLRAWSFLLVLPVFVMASWVAATPVVLAWGVTREMLAGCLLGSYGGIWFGQTIQAAIASEKESWHVKALDALGMPGIWKGHSISLGVIHHALGAMDLFVAVLLTGGTVVVEYAFHIEGLGLLLLDSLLVMDIPVARSLLAMTILTYVALSTMIISARGAIDPRVWEIEK